MLRMQRFRLDAASRHGEQQDGQSLAEFALVLLVFVVLVVAVFDIGRAVFAYTAITNATREGARLAIVNQDTPSIQGRAMSQAAGHVAALDDVTVEFTMPASGDQCDGLSGRPRLTIGCEATVGATTRWTAITPLIGNILGPMTFSASSSIPVEFVCGIPTAPITNPASCPKQP